MTALERIGAGAELDALPARVWQVGLTNKYEPIALDIAGV